MKRFETYLNEGGFESRHIQVHSHGQMTWGTVGDAYEGYNYLGELDDDSLYWLIVGHHIEGERRYGPYMTREYAQRIAIVIHGRGVEAERACPTPRPWVITLERSGAFTERAEVDVMAATDVDAKDAARGLYRDGDIADDEWEDASRSVHGYIVTGARKVER